MSENLIFGVCGEPIVHSRSPEMFNAAFRELGIDAEYVRIAAAGIEETMFLLKGMKLKGINVTAPFKREIMGYLDDVDHAARIIDAVNVIVVKSGRCIGFNTDRFGAVYALKSSGIEIANKKVVIVGAGGAGRAAAFGLQKAGADVALLSRDNSRAVPFAVNLGCQAFGLEDLEEQVSCADIVISCLPQGVNVIDGSLLKPEHVVMDANYDRSLLLAAAKKQGCTCVDGLRWLLYQAVPAFELFVGQRAPMNVMEKALHGERRQLKSNIALIGAMGVGKSVVSRSIASELGMEIIDIDETIEEQAGMKISDIFDEHGEEHFRGLEKNALAKAKDLDHTVVACGGGIILDPDNLNVLREHCYVIWLWAGVQTILERLHGAEERRPLLAVPDKIKTLKNIIIERMPLYAKAADLVITTEGYHHDYVTRRVVEQVHSCLVGTGKG